MVTPAQALKKYGDPNNKTAMTIWSVPTNLVVGIIPRRIYCNKDMVEPLTKALTALVDTGLVHELKSFDGCFNIRTQVGSATAKSLHSWGLAIDVNASTNGFNKKPTMSAGVVKCFTDNGFDWGGTWHKPDGMHFQLAKLP